MCEARWTRTAKAKGVKAFVLCVALFSLAACADTGPNTHLDWPVNTRTSSNWPNATYLTVVVRPNDNIDSIAARDSAPPSAIERMNDLSAHSALHPGEILRLPPGSRATRTSVLKEAETNHVYA